MKRTSLIRRIPMRAWRRDEADKVTTEDRDAVLERDKGCVANLLGAVEQCRDNWGNPLTLQGRYHRHLLELDHIRPFSMTGKRGPSELRWMVLLCPFHHRLGNPPWATGNRDVIRDYLERVSGESVW